MTMTTHTTSTAPSDVDAPPEAARLPHTHRIFETRVAPRSVA